MKNWYQHLSPLGDSRKHRLSTLGGLKGKLRPTENSWKERSVKILRNCFNTNMDFDWFWVGSGEPVLVASLGTLEGPASFAPATSPEMFSGSLDSVCFNRGNEHDFVEDASWRSGCLGLETGQHHR